MRKTLSLKTEVKVDVPKPLEKKNTHPRDDAAALQRRYSKSFGKFLPLKVGIKGDLRITTGWDEDRLAKAIRYHCRNFNYLGNSSREGALRVDLDGTPVGAVDEDGRKYAAMRLSHLRKKQNA